jgi:excisionase family DNA binding protein
MPKKTAPEGALFVRLPANAVEKLHRAAEALGVRKKDLVAGLVSKYVDPDSQRGLHDLGSLATHKVTMDLGGSGPARGSYSFQPYDPPEVMNAEQAGQFLQIEEAVVIEMAEAGKLPGRKLGASWRFSRAALVAWLSPPEKR